MSIDDFYRKLCRIRSNVHRMSLGGVNFAESPYFNTPSVLQTVRDDLWFEADEIWKSGRPHPPEKSDDAKRDIDVLIKWVRDAMTMEAAKDPAPKPPNPNQLVDDTTDIKGFVVNPHDKKAYRPASRIVAEFSDIVKDTNALKRILTRHTEIRRWKPTKNRLKIHLVDWQVYADKHRADPSQSELHDDPDEIKRRANEIRHRKPLS